MSRRILCLVSVCWTLSACEVLARRDVPTDPKSDAVKKETAKAAVQVAPVSMILSTVAAESDHVGTGGLVGITVTLKDTTGTQLKSGGLTVEFQLLGGTSTGTFDTVVDNGDGTYVTTLTGGHAGTASRIIGSIDGSYIQGSQPSITVDAGVATKVSIETAGDGSGQAITGVTLNDGAPLTLYAVSRDADDNFVEGVTADWTQSVPLGTFSQTTSPATTFTPVRGTATTVISADFTGLTSGATGNILNTWTPPTIAGLQSWLKADALYAATNGSAVASWTDVSWHNNDAVQATALNKPKFKTGAVNGKPALVFDGINSFMTITDAASLRSTVVSVFAVIKNMSPVAYSPVITKTTDASWTDGWGLADLAGDGATFGFFVNNYTTHKSAGSVGTGSYVYLSATYDKSNVRFFKSGVAQTVSAYSTNISSPMADVYIGKTNTGSVFLDAEIAEILIYDTGLSSANRGLVEGYLTTKYGL
ncbi:MAG: hypothetical protein JST16_03440 [Bdellovibrionales bacterium]|nr:hypothetical protein [Bdellovibrionales bacterium]